MHRHTRARTRCLTPSLYQSCQVGRSLSLRVRLKADEPVGGPWGVVTFSWAFISAVVKKWLQMKWIKKLWGKRWEDVRRDDERSRVCVTFFFSAHLTLGDGSSLVYATNRWYLYVLTYTLWWTYMTTNPMLKNSLLIFFGLIPFVTQISRYYNHSWECTKNPCI